MHKSGEVYDQVWQKADQPEKDRDPQKKGYAVLVRVERAEDLDGEPLKLLVPVLSWAAGRSALPWRSNWAGAAFPAR